MSFLQLAVNCPTPIVNTTLNLLADAYNSAGVNGAKVLPTLVQGTYSLASEYNKQALMIELLGRNGCGTYCIANGLVISAGTGLVVNVSAGQAWIDGLVEIVATTYTVPASQATIWIWLKQNGTLTHSLTTGVPAGGLVCLGYAVTSASAVTSVDFSGVMYSRGSMAVRTTADTSIPTDIPSSALAFLTNTTGGLYLWNGLAYMPMYTVAQNAEVVQDIVGAMVTDGNGIDFTYSDGGATLTVAYDSFDETVHRVFPTNAETITATKTLVLTDKNFQALIASGASRDVRLPPNTSLTFGHYFRILNVGATNNILIKDTTGATTLVTLLPAQYCDIYATTNAGVANWPNAATAISMGTPL